jgi:hypothetical protein
MSDEILKLDKMTARALAYGQVGEHIYGYEIIENKIEDTNRWSVICFLVIKSHGELGFWATHYQRGATEYQSEEPFEYEDGEFYRVKPKHVSTIEWVGLND